jgi:hypothetical protein
MTRNNWEAQNHVYQSILGLDPHVCEPALGLWLEILVDTQFYVEDRVKDDGLLRIIEVEAERHPLSAEQQRIISKFVSKT